MGPSGFSFNSSYRNRDVLEYKQELGNAIGMLKLIIHHLFFQNARSASIFNVIITSIYHLLCLV